MTTAQLAQPFAPSTDQVDWHQTATTLTPTIRTYPTIGRTMMVAIAWTTLAIFILTGVPMWLLTGQVWDIIGLGAFCAFWGGPGFGAMIGGMIWTERQERLDAEHNDTRTAEDA